MNNKYKISPLSYFTFESDGMELTNSKSKKTIRIDNKLLELILHMKEAKSYNEIEKFVCENLKIEKYNLEEFFNYLIKNKFLIKEGDKIEKYYELWKSYGWINSLIYHTYTYDYPVLDYSTPASYVRDQKTMKKFINQEDEPSIYKEVTGEKVNLPKVRTHSSKNFYEIFDVEKQLNTELDLQLLSDILFYTYGQISSLKFPVTQKLIRRTSPSGGARHPSECYIAILNSGLLKKGIYHYSVKNHCLELIKEGDFKEYLYESCYGLNQFEKEAEIVFLHTSIFPRNWFRYREPKTYKVIYYDFGHILYNFKLITRLLGLASYTIGSGLNDDNVERLLDIDGYNEGIIYFTAI
ncbi:SagB/ThcOx family dehydrogenase [Staphylococcus pseudintermedius]|nr:SagB/ThcOx family dehydrogenase [Staphylococcus pseudintermedius]